MAFWLAAALLNIFGREPSGSGAVPENRTWTAFFCASSGGSSEAAAAAPGGLPTSRRAAGAAVPAPSLAGGTHPAPLDGNSASRKRSGFPASLRDPKPHAQGIWDRRSHPRGCGHVAVTAPDGAQLLSPRGWPPPRGAQSAPCLARRSGQEKKPGAHVGKQPWRETRLCFAPSPPILLFFFFWLPRVLKKNAPAWQRLFYCFLDKQRSGWELPSLLGLLGVPGSL